MKMSKQAALLLIAFVSLRLRATTYYVAKNGNDNNPGTEAQPWLSIPRAISVAAAGDTVWVKQGTYDSVNLYGQLTFNGNDGTAADPIVFKSYDGWNTILNSTVRFYRNHIVLDGFKILGDAAAFARGGGYAYLVRIEYDSCRIHGCEIVESPAHSAAIGSTIGILFNGASYGNVIDSNVIHGFGYGGHGDGIYAHSSTHGQFTYNTVYDNIRIGMQIYPNSDSNLIAYNTVYSSTEGGIVVEGDSNSIHDNVCYDGGICGLHVYREEPPEGEPNSRDGTDNDVYNNICYGNNVGIKVTATGANVFRNNICFANASQELYLDSLANNKLDYNCYYPDGAAKFSWGGSGNFAAWQASTRQDGNSISADPCLTDPAGHDFRPTDSSPCIDAGDPTTPPGFDFDGFPAPFGSAVDMGVYEYHTSGESLDVGVYSIAAPTGTLDSGSTITPQAWVVNYGKGAASFPVTMRIATDYSDTRAVSGLGPGDSALVVFGNWTAGRRGAHAVRCSTGLTGDRNHGNDAVSGSVAVRVLDVGVGAIVAPADTVDSGADVATQAWVRNYGTDAVSFPVKFWIDSFYSDSEMVSGLAPGDSALVAFTHWQAIQRGNHAKRCGTALSGDANPTCDTLSGTVVVCVPRRVDAGVVSIIRPAGTYRPRESVTPAVTVRNYGNVPVSFDAWMLLTSPKGPYYSDRVHVANLDTAGDLVVDGFRSCKLRYSGDWTARCSLALADDEFYGNNVLAAGFRVSSESLGMSSAPESPSLRPVKDRAGLACAGTDLNSFAKGENTSELSSFSFAPDDSTPLVQRVGVMAAPTRPADGCVAITWNPFASGYALLRCNLPEAGPATFDVVGMTGRVLLTQTLVVGQNGITRLDLRKLTSGVYLVKVTSKGFYTTRRLVITR